MQRCSKPKRQNSMTPQPQVSIFINDLLEEFEDFERAQEKDLTIKQFDNIIKELKEELFN